MQHNFLNKAKQWTDRSDGINFLTDEEYCASRDIFQTRLEKLRVKLEQNDFPNTALLIATIGEIGNNSFDHNIGNWRDVPGVYFDFDHDSKSSIIADRGQGIRKTISRVRPEVANDTEALKIAFTEVISGRSPEQRGNGLKFVKKIIEDQRWKLNFMSGSAVAKTNDVRGLEFSENSENVLGCVAFIQI